MTGSSLGSGHWIDAFFAAVTLTLIVLVVVLLKTRSRHDPDVHSPRLAWLRGGIYLCCALLFGAATGVVENVLTSPIATREQLADPAWVALTGLCLVITYWAYVVWWPRGTVTHGRKAHPFASAFFGALWGLGAAQLQLGLFDTFAGLGLSRAAAAIAVFFSFAIFTSWFQLSWWDVRVSPPHNVRAWNAKKVLFAHNPFLIATLVHLTLYGNAALFSGFQALALGCAAVAMRFPPFWSEDGKEKVSRETALGI